MSSPLVTAILFSAVQIGQPSDLVLIDGVLTQQGLAEPPPPLLKLRDLSVLCKVWPVSTSRSPPTQRLRDIAMVPFPADGAPNTEAVIFDNSARQNFDGDIGGNFGIRC